MSALAGSPPRSALLATWGNAWLRAEAGLDELLQRVGGADDDHQVAGLAPDDLPLEGALGRLRASGVTRLRVVLPVAGDVLGLPGPGPFTDAAVAAGEGVLAIREDSTAAGLVPHVSVHASPFDGTVTLVRWSTYPGIDVPPVDPGPFLHDAEHDLRVGVVECARALADLDVARWRPELADELADLRRDTRRAAVTEELPGGLPARALQLLVQARALARVLGLAAADDGAAVSGGEAAARAAALAELSRAVRRAHVAAYNAYGAAG